MTCCPSSCLELCHRGMRSSGTGCPSVQHNSTCQHVTADTVLSPAVTDSLCHSFFLPCLLLLLLQVPHDGSPAALQVHLGSGLPCVQPNASMAVTAC